MVLRSASGYPGMGNDPVKSSFLAVSSPLRVRAATEREKADGGYDYVPQPPSFASEYLPSRAKHGVLWLGLVFLYSQLTSYVYRVHHIGTLVYKFLRIYLRLSTKSCT